MDRLKGKKALVVGASTGIGREVCRLFALEGADVAVADHRHEEDKASLIAEIRAMGREAFALEVNVLEEHQVQAVVEKTIERFGVIDILVNNAGIGGYRGPIESQTREQWDEVLDIDLRGIFFGMKHVLPHMVARGSGRIVNTSSQLAHKPGPFAAAYCAAKAGIVALSASVAQEVALKGITVNVVCPGATDTAHWREPGNEEVKQRRIENLPMRRVAQPIEIAWAYVYLASDEASYCTGQSLSPNGGDVMW